MKTEFFKYELDSIVVNNETNERYIIDYKMCDDSSFCIRNLNTGERLYITQINLNKYFSREKYKIITLCGSTRFKNKFLEIQKKLTLKGNIVLTLGIFGHSGDDEAWSEDINRMLNTMQLTKIDMADEIFVINVGGYIEESTKNEIEYAKSKGKIIKYLESGENL